MGVYSLGLSISDLDLYLLCALGVYTLGVYTLGVYSLGLPIWDLATHLPEWGPTLLGAYTLGAYTSSGYRYWIWGTTYPFFRDDLEDPST